MPYKKSKADYIVKPDKYKHKKPKSRNPWSPNYDDSPQEETSYFSQPQDYSQGYVNPYVNTPDAPVFDTPSAQDNAANLQDFMDSNKPPHLQNRWKQQPERFTFSQPIEKCGCEPKQEEYELDYDNIGKVPYMYGKAYHPVGKPVWKKEVPIWERVINNTLKHQTQKKCDIKPQNVVGEVRCYDFDNSTMMFGFKGSWDNVTFYSDEYNKDHIRYKQIKKSVTFLNQSLTARKHLNKIFEYKETLKVYFYDFYTNIDIDSDRIPDGNMFSDLMDLGLVSNVNKIKY